MEPVRVELGPDWVDLEPEVTLPMGMAAMYVVATMSEETEAELRGALAPVLLRFGIRAWSFPDRINDVSIARLLPFGTSGFEVADAAFGLYLGDIIAPLAARRNRRSEPGPRDDSTSQTPASGPKLPTQPLQFSHESTVGKPSEVPAL